jgi:Actin
MTTTASAIRPGLRENRTLSGSPHTPSRFISSNYSSPGSNFRQEEDAVIFELTPRQILAGFEGESSPQCIVNFSPENAGRMGDYNSWLPGYTKVGTNLVDEATKHELWLNDVKDVDLGLLEDRIERAVREVYNKHLLVDAGTARLVLVLPSIVPLPVLPSLLTILFERWKYSTIALLPRSPLCAISAGVRSALVVDIGWEETIVTPVYEYRELPTHRTIRAMKTLILKTGEKLEMLSKQHPLGGGESLRLDFDFVEDFVSRAAICGREEKKPDQSMATIPEDEPEESVSTLLIEWPSQSTTHGIHVGQSEISNTVYSCFFGDHEDRYQDDQERPLSDIVFRCLVGLPPDVRATCMARIIFTGTGAAVSGLKETTLQELKSIIEVHGWSSVRGKHSKTKVRPVGPTDARHNVPLPLSEKNDVEEHLRKLNVRDPSFDISGTIRCIDSLGPWAGASLLTSLKVKSVVEIERERFLSHGLSGATKDLDLGLASQRMSTFGAGGIKGGEQSSWTLGTWG